MEVVKFGSDVKTLETIKTIQEKEGIATLSKTIMKLVVLGIKYYTNEDIKKLNVKLDRIEEVLSSVEAKR